MTDAQYVRMERKSKSFDNSKALGEEEEKPCFPPNLFVCYTPVVLGD
jgi:hypothetical protein